MKSPPVLSDSYGRVMRDLRISLTDRCNFRCLYCLPETEAAANFYQSRAHSESPQSARKLKLPPWKPRWELLTFEEIERLVRIAAGLGIEKIRLTGGEPLLRSHVEDLVARLAVIPGIRDLAMTTNGFLFPQKASALKAAGLRRASFSLDSLDRENFKRMTGRDGLESVLQSLEIARELGLTPIKVNAVVIRGLNDHEIEPLADFARERGFSMRFIEFMPLDSSRAWLREMVTSGKEILERVRKRHVLRPAERRDSAETAKRWEFEEGKGEIGIIAPVTEPFCGHCNRIRLTADGKIRTCLFSLHEHDLRSRLRAGADDGAIAAELGRIVGQKEDRHHVGEKDFVQPERTMSCIGG